MDFKRILGRFLEGFDFTAVQTMIRATKETSLDGWVDGWMDFGKPQGIQKLLKIAKLASAAHLGFPCDLGGRFWNDFKRF